MKLEKSCKSAGSQLEREIAAMSTAEAGMDAALLMGGDCAYSNQFWARFHGEESVFCSIA